MQYHPLNHTDTKLQAEQAASRVTQQSQTVCVYRGASFIDDLSHEIGVKHSFSYNGEPCE